MGSTSLLNKPLQERFGGSRTRAPVYFLTIILGWSVLAVPAGPKNPSMMTIVKPGS